MSGDENELFSHRMLRRKVHVDEKVELLAELFNRGQALLEIGVLQMTFGQLVDQRLAEFDSGNVG